MKTPWIVLSALLTLALAGCTGGGGGGSEGEVPEQDEQGRYVIHMQSNNRFSPEVARVPVGATVVWVNDGGSHNVVPDGHSQWQASQVASQAGEHHTATLDEAGSFDYFCQPHRSLGMTGTIIVTE